ncbi:MAG: guanylate kinase [Lentisphaeria bacterium]
MSGKIGAVILISGPSGAGKSTLLKPILQQDKNLQFSVSCTTRTIRKGEQDGIDYHFLSVEKFKQKIAAGDFLEWALVHDNFYGTLKSSVLDQVKSGKDVILDIDVQGALQIKELLQSDSTSSEIKLSDLISYVFISPPSYEILENRLRARGTESEDSLKKRLQNSKGEMLQFSKYDYLIVNTDVDIATNQLKSVISACRCSTGVQKHNINFQ